MNPQIELKQNKFGSYDIMIYFNNATDTEFSFDFLSKNKLDEKINQAAAKINESSKKIKVRAVNILVSGIIVASIPFASMMNVFAADKYSMAYLYTGTPSQQVNYINRTNNALNTVSPSYFDLTADGNLKLNAVSTELVNAAHSKGMKVIPFLSNHWDRTSGINALNNIENLTTQIANAIQQYNLDGVNIDIENVTEAQKNAYVELTKALREKISSDKEVSVAVAANPNGWATGWHGSYDYTNLAKNSDYLMIMSYDEHWQGSAPGPVASISFVENSIRYGLSKTTKDKLVLGLPFYGRIWSSDNNFNGNGISLEQVSRLISDYNATVTYDTASQSPKAVFTVKDGDPQNTVNSKKVIPGTYTVWFENEQSFMKKMEMINKYDIKGAGAWALGQETSSIWQNYSSWLSGNFNYSDSGLLPPQEQESESNAEITTGIVTATTLNVRNTPSTSGGIIITLSKNASVEILSTANGWHKIRLGNGQIGYVSVDYIMLSSPVIPADPPPVVTPDVPDVNTQTGGAVDTATVTGIVTATTLNVRSTPSTSAKALTTLKKNASVEIISTANGWHNIRLSNGQTGYVSADYITLSGSAATVTPTPPATTPAPETGGSEIVTLTGIVTATTLNVRNTPSTSAKALTALKKNAGVEIISTANGWHNIRLSNGQTGYVSADYIRLSVTTPPPSDNADNTVRTGTVTATTLNVRNTPSTSGKVVKTLKKNASVKILSASNGWYSIDLGNGSIGYVSAQYVK